MNRTVDINCDMGEGFPYDGEIMPYISSANIACGFHAGNSDLIKKTIELALKHGVAVGAHPSFPDRENFGRTNMQLGLTELTSVINEQLYIFETVCENFGLVPHHIKLHGALYNMSAGNETLAISLLNILSDYKKKSLLYGLSGSLFNRLAERSGFRIAHEVFADRTYQPGGILTPRSEPNALIINEDAAVQQVLQMVLEKRVHTVEDTYASVQADTICIHGDNRQAARFAQRLHAMVNDNFITLRAPQL